MAFFPGRRWLAVFAVLLIRCLGPAVLGAKCAFGLWGNPFAFVLLSRAAWLPRGYQVTFAVANQISPSHTLQSLT